MERYVIGLDFGTLSGRAALFSVKNGEMIATVVHEYAHGVMQDTLPDGVTKLGVNWCLQDPADYLEVLTETVPTLLREAGVSKDAVVGLSIDFTASTLLPLDRDAMPLSMQPRFAHRPHAYVKLWKHHAAQPEADEINRKLSEFPNEVARYYGERISPEILLPKALQLLREDPELYEEMDSFCEAADWINRLLTGEKKRSISTAGYKAMYFNGHGYPGEDFFRRIDPKLEHFVSEKLQGDICQMTERFGRLTKEWADKLGLREGMAIGCSIIDAHAGITACGITRPGRMMLALGTSSVQAALCQTPYSGEGVIGAIRDGVVPGYYLWESGLAAVGDQLAWFAESCVPFEGEPDTLAALTRRAEVLQPGESGLLALDWWNGNKTPYVDGNLSGALIGLRLETTPAEIFRALLESTAFGTRMIMDAFKHAGMEEMEVIACGGVAEKNPLLLQIYADVLGCEIKVAGCAQTMALGAGIYAAVAAGAAEGGYDTLEEAVARMTRLKDVSYIPDAGRHEVYEQLYRQYQELSTWLGKKNALSHRLRHISDEVKRSGTGKKDG